jgi:hypothetical protein
LAKHVPYVFAFYVTVRRIIIVIIIIIIINLSKIVPVRNKESRQEDVWGNGGIDSRIMNLSTRWKYVVSFMSLPIYL